MEKEKEELREYIASLESDNNDSEIEELRQHIGMYYMYVYGCTYVYG